MKPNNDFYAKAESWKEVIKEAEVDGYEKGKKEERERILKIIDKWNKDSLRFNMDFVNDEGSQLLVSECELNSSLKELKQKIQEEK